MNGLRLSCLLLFFVSADGFRHGGRRVLKSELVGLEGGEIFSLRDFSPIMLLNLLEMTSEHSSAFRYGHEFEEAKSGSAVQLTAYEKWALKELGFGQSALQKTTFDTDHEWLEQLPSLQVIGEALDQWEDLIQVSGKSTTSLSVDEAKDAMKTKLGADHTFNDLLLPVFEAMASDDDDKVTACGFVKSVLLERQKCEPGTVVLKPEVKKILNFHAFLATRLGSIYTGPGGPCANLEEYLATCATVLVGSKDIVWDAIAKGKDAMLSKDIRRMLRIYDYMRQSGGNLRAFFGLPTVDQTSLKYKMAEKLFDTIKGTAGTTFVDKLKGYLKAVLKMETSRIPTSATQIVGDLKWGDPDDTLFDDKGKFVQRILGTPALIHGEAAPTDAPETPSVQEFVDYVAKWLKK